MTRSREGTKACTSNTVRRKGSITKTLFLALQEASLSSLSINFVKGRKGGILDCFLGQIYRER